MSIHLQEKKSAFYASDEIIITIFFAIYSAFHTKQMPWTIRYLLITEINTLKKKVKN